MTDASRRREAVEAVAGPPPPEASAASPAAPRPARFPVSPRPSVLSDRRLVGDCLSGNQQAWSCLLEKYKNLIYSIPFKYGATREDAADIFQAVCLELFTELPRVRNTDNLRGWLMTVTAHQAFHWKRRHQRASGREVHGLAEESLPPLPPAIAWEVEREQMVREAVARLPARSRELIRMLFFEHPARPYAEVAERLGLAEGSIGFTRARCLKRLQRILEELGF
jgi:RNA polymerase sigma factor (sigma-70 family)